MINLTEDKDYWQLLGTSQKEFDTFLKQFWKSSKYANNLRRHPYSSKSTACRVFYSNLKRPQEEQTVHLFIEMEEDLLKFLYHKTHAIYKKALLEAFLKNEGE